ncbi:MAG: hypothetical protein GY851_05065 [bacterium]|nr:hypothetical protein [bacterium]
MKMTKKPVLLFGAMIAVALLLSAPVFAADEEDPRASDPNYTELKLELPEPSFSGTPLDYWSEHLDISFKPRPTKYVPKGTTNISQGKPVTSSDTGVSPEKLKMVTDGDAKWVEDSLLVLKPGVQWIQIDLGAKQALDAMLLWHFHEYERVYFDVVIKVSCDPKFEKDVTVVFNNDYDKSAELGEGKDKEFIEKTEGRFFDLKGIEARYVRLYSNGNTTDDTNTYIEVKVFGRAAKEGS